MSPVWQEESYRTATSDQNSLQPQLKQKIWAQKTPWNASKPQNLSAKTIVKLQNETKLEPQSETKIHITKENWTKQNESETIYVEVCVRTLILVFRWWLSRTGGHWVPTRRPRRKLAETEWTTFLSNPSGWRHVPTVTSTSSWMIRRSTSTQRAIGSSMRTPVASWPIFILNCQGRRSVPLWRRRSARDGRSAVARQRSAAVDRGTASWNSRSSRLLTVGNHFVHRRGMDSDAGITRCQEEWLWVHAQSTSSMPFQPVGFCNAHRRHHCCCCLQFIIIIIINSSSPSSLAPLWSNSLV